MAIVSAVAYGARALNGAAAGTSGAVPSQNFTQKLWGHNRFCSVQWSLSRGESSSYSQKLFASAVTYKALSRARRTSIIRASSVADDDMDLEVDMEIEPKRPLRPVVERFRIHHEKNVTAERLKELGVERWSKWDCGPGVTAFWKWQVDEMVYISKGSVEVVPEGCWDGAFFYAGDIVRFPKWFEASMTFDEDYEQHYKFFAYGD